jgi:hypothetical protein
LLSFHQLSFSILRLYADITLVSFLMTLDSAAQIREYCHTYLGNSSSVDAFCDGFIAQRDFVLGFDTSS